MPRRGKFGSPKRRVSKYDTVGSSGSGLLTKEDVYERLSPYNLAFLVQHADWCGHCVRLLDKLKQHKPNLLERPEQLPTVIFAQENTFDQDSLPVEGFPTVTIFSRGEKVDLPAVAKALGAEDLNERDLLEKYIALVAQQSA